MDLDDIRKRLNRGFTPFIIKTADGDEYEVPHREFIMVTPRSVVVADATGYVNIIYPNHIVALREAGELPVN